MSHAISTVIEKISTEKLSLKCYSIGFFLREIYIGRQIVRIVRSGPFKAEISPFWRLLDKTETKKMLIQRKELQLIKSNSCTYFIIFQSNSSYQILLIFNPSTNVDSVLDS